MVLRILILLLFCLSLSAQVVKQFKVEYRKDAAGNYNAYLINKYKAAATAFILQATYQLEGKQQPTAWGGDSYLYPDGGSEVPAGFESQSTPLPPGATPLTAGVIAVIYNDGFSEGDEDVVQMFLAGRKRSLADVNQVLQDFDKGVSKPMMSKLAANLRAADLQEAAKLDGMITVPGVKHAYFMTAVPAWLLKDQAPSADTYQRWRARLVASKPAL